MLPTSTVDATELVGRRVVIDRQLVPDVAPVPI